MGSRLEEYFGIVSLGPTKSAGGGHAGSFWTGSVEIEATARAGGIDGLCPMDADHAGEVQVERAEVEPEPILVLRLGCGFFGFVSDTHKAPGQYQ
jgi:hypothetical protein